MITQTVVGLGRFGGNFLLIEEAKTFELKLLINWGILLLTTQVSKWRTRNVSPFHLNLLIYFTDHFS